MAKLNLSTASREELVDLIRRQNARVKELQNASLLLEERDARLSSMELTVQLCKDELQEEKASHVADRLAMQEQIQQLSQALVEAHDRISAADSKMAAYSGASSSSQSPDRPRGLPDEAVVGVLNSRIYRLEGQLRDKSMECESLTAANVELQRRVAELDRDNRRAVDAKELLADKQRLTEELEERFVELRAQQHMCQELRDRVDSLSQQLAAFELEAAVIHADPHPLHGTGTAQHHRAVTNVPKPATAMPPRAASTASIARSGSIAKVKLVSSGSTTSSTSSSSSSTSDDDTPDSRLSASPAVKGEHHHPQQARVIGLDGAGASTNSAAMFGTMGGNTTARLKRQVNDLTLELRRREEAAAARSREEATNRSALQDRIKELQQQLDEARAKPSMTPPIPERSEGSRSVNGGPLNEADHVTKGPCLRLQGDGEEAVLLQQQVDTIRKLVDFYHRHKHCAKAV